MTNASKITYLQQLYTGDLENNTVSILDYIHKEGRKSTYHLRNELMFPHQTLTSSLSNLMDEGLIQVVDTISIELDGRFRSYSVYEYVHEELEQIKLSEARHLEKANNWLKGYEKYKDILKISLIEY